MISTLSDRQALWVFVLGCAGVTAGVLLHLPMFTMAQTMGYRLAGMPMDIGIVIGMALSIAALVPPLAVVATAIIAPVGLAVVLAARFGLDTRGRDLRDLDAGAGGASAIAAA